MKKQKFDKLTGHTIIPAIIGFGLIYAKTFTIVGWALLVYAISFTLFFFRKEIKIGINYIKDFVKKLKEKKGVKGE